MDAERIGRPSPADLLLGVTTLLWYAAPDVVPDRRVRGVLKAGLLVGSAALFAVTSDHDAETGDGETEMPDLDWQTGVAVGAAIVAATAASVLAERWIHRGAQALGRKGLRWPHTVVGLGLGAITTAMRPLSRT